MRPEPPPGAAARVERNIVSCVLAPGRLRADRYRGPPWPRLDLSLRPMLCPVRRAGAAFPFGRQSWKLNILFHHRISHQARVYVPPSILAVPRSPGSSFRSVLSIGMMTSYTAVSGLAVARLGIGLGSHLALGHVGNLGRDLLAAPLGDFARPGTCRSTSARP